MGCKCMSFQQNEFNHFLFLKFVDDGDRSADTEI